MRGCCTLAFLIAAIVGPSVLAGAQTSTRLADGVVRYDKSATPTLWQIVQDRFGWIVKSRPWGRSVAFIVGVGDYAYLTPKLTYVASDLSDLREFLLNEGGFDVVYVAQDRVATADLVDRYMFNELPRVLVPEDRLLFYFSGHGADVSGLGYMQFANAKSDFERSQYLEVNRTEQWSKVIPAKHVLFLIDACNSGLGYDAKGEGGLPVDQELVIQFSGDGSRNVLTAGTGNEKAYQVSEGNRQGYSVFTHAFLDAIRQTTLVGGFLTLTEVLAGVQRRVAEFSRGQPGRQMTPRLWPIPRQPGKDKGSFVFLNPRASRPPVPATISQYVSVSAKEGVKPADSVAIPVSERSTIRGTLAAYRAAWENMDLGALVSVYPSFKDRAALQKQFSDLSGIALAMGPADIKQDSTSTAVATCDYSATFTSRFGKISQTKPQRAEFRLSRTGETWQIDSVTLR